MTRLPQLPNGLHKHGLDWCVIATICGPVRPDRALVENTAVTGCCPMNGGRSYSATVLFRRMHGLFGFLATEVKHFADMPGACPSRHDMYCTVPKHRRDGRPHD